MPELTEIEAAIRVRMSPDLLRWFTSFAPKHGSDRKLQFRNQGGEYFYDSDELDDFNDFLKERWPTPPKQKRPPVPAGIQREIMIEANHKCAFCEYVAHGEGAHIDAVAKSGCNHPHNLIWACPNHHTEYDHGLKVKSVVKADHVKVMKEILQETQLRRWRIEFRAVSSLLSLIEDLEKVRKLLKDPQLLDIHKALKHHATSVLKSVGEEAAVADEKKPETATKNYRRYLQKITSIIPANDSAKIKELDEVVEEVVDATDDYLEKESLAKCPLCRGSGDHNRRECPICKGEGTVPKEVVSDIDLRPFKQAACPVCEGKGTHNRFDCTVCLGVGTVDTSDIGEIDTRPFKQVTCPLCKGRGTHNTLECRICVGVGTIDRRALEDLDLSGFKQDNCPLCKGSGTRKGSDCVICLGVGTINRRDADDIDLNQFKQVECPLCHGDRRFRAKECPFCSGDGEVDRRDAESADLGMFED